MIPIKEAIESGAWLMAHSERYDEKVSFQLKVTDFKKVDLISIKESNTSGDDFDIAPLNITSNVWLLSIQIVNLCKKEVSASDITDPLVLVDADDFQFVHFDCAYLCSYSDFSESSGTKNFYAEELPPKIKRSGAILYELPEFFENLSLDIRDGAIREA